MNAKLSEIPRDMYLNLVELEKIGGKTRNTQIESLMTASAYASHFAEQVHTPARPAVVPMKPILMAHPEIEVRVNGRDYPLVLDTGRE